MTNYSIESCRQLYALNKVLVEGEINFNRTVLFMSEIDLSEIEAIRGGAAVGEKPTYTAFIARAIALALIDFPYANRRLFHLPGLPFFSYFQSFKDTDIAVAIEKSGVGQDATAIMEIIPNAGHKSLAEITKMLRQFSESTLESSRQWQDFYRLGTRYPRWIAGRLVRLPWYVPAWWKKYRGGSAMISSPAKYGVDGVVAAWTHTISFSFGLAQKKPMVKNDQVVAVRAFTFCMNWDRRVMAGAQAARLFARICDLLRHPNELLASPTGLSEPPEEVLAPRLNPFLRFVSWILRFK